VALESLAVIQTSQHFSRCVRAERKETREV